MIKQLPIAIRAAHKSDVRSQFAAFCFRLSNGKPEVLLITSRRSGRWIIPKGWPMDGLTPAETAAQEAWEEAGVIGKPMNQCLGLFSFNKYSRKGLGLPCVALVYPLRVKKLADSYPERKERRRKWFSLVKASTKVQEPELSRIIRDFDPRRLN